MFLRCRSGFLAAGIGVLTVLAASCERRETSERRMPAPGRLDTPAGLESGLQPGAAIVFPEIRNPYEGDASGISEGRRLYQWYNCSGCHFNGGGGIGPPFLDADWIYGREPANIFNSIVRGRPNGMPAYGRRIPEQQVWQIAAYVASLDPRQPDRAPPGAREPLVQEEGGDREGTGPRGGQQR
ncbi:MAG: c-type cytochrome [Bryobacteraceae bacterium]|nr:c-type cytochrome [Bryobacteraceae bacterium]